MLGNDVFIIKDAGKKSTTSNYYRDQQAVNIIEAYEAEIPRGIDLFCGQTQFYPNIGKYLKRQYSVSKRSLKGMSLESRVEYGI